MSGYVYFLSGEVYGVWESFSAAEQAMFDAGRYGGTVYPLYRMAGTISTSETTARPRRLSADAEFLALGQ